MAISRSIRPTVVVAGTVVRRRDLRRKADQTQYGTEVVVQQESGAQIAYTVYDLDQTLPGVGEFVAIEASVEESREFGASLRYESEAFNTLDLIHSSLATPAGK